MSGTGISRRGFLRASTAAAAGLAASGCSKSAKQADLEEENRALVRRYVEELWGQYNTDLVDEIVAPDFVTQPSGYIRGRTAFKEWVTEVRTVWPDPKTNIEVMIAEGDKVAYWRTTTTTTEGRVFGLAPESKPVKISSVSIVRIEDGMIAELWQEWNSWDVYTQIGGVPAQETE